MPVFALDEKLIFPPVHLSEPDGLLAMGGDLSEERLLLAYRNGIFPWYEGEIPLWWSPDPRFILYPSELRISKSMKSLLRKKHFQFTTNQAFPEVIRHCRATPRAGQDGTWITGEVENAYTRLHQSGWAHSAEAWENGQLVGGLYGIRMGTFFFGESMFSHVSNASKFAFIRYIQQLVEEGVTLIDCQVHSAHLESLGARMMPRRQFIETIRPIS